MARLSAPLVFLALFIGLPGAAGTSMRLSANPIRRVVTMLQMMQSKIEQEGKTEQDSYVNFASISVLIQIWLKQYFGIYSDCVSTSFTENMRGNNITETNNTQQMANKSLEK